MFVHALVLRALFPACSADSSIVLGESFAAASIAGVGFGRAYLARTAAIAAANSSLASSRLQRSKRLIE
jgi:hypothetical protein